MSTIIKPYLKSNIDRKHYSYHKNKANGDTYSSVVYKTIATEEYVCEYCLCSHRLVFIDTNGSITVNCGRCIVRSIWCSWWCNVADASVECHMVQSISFLLSEYGHCLHCSCLTWVNTELSCKPRFLFTWWASSFNENIVIHGYSFISY